MTIQPDLSRWAVAITAFLLSAACAGGGLKAPPGTALEVVRTLPHDEAAYTQGLLYHDGAFYESTGIYGESSLRRVDIETGEVLERRDLPASVFGEGLALLGSRLYQLTWREKIVLVYDVETFEELGGFPYDGEGWGLTTDGTHLILSDGSFLLRFFDPATFELVRQVEVRHEGEVVMALNELEWVRGEVWANIYEDDRIARIDPRTGEVIGWVSTDSLLSWWDRRRGADVANGIAYDSVGDRLWLTGKRWPLVFEVGRPE